MIGCTGAFCFLFCFFRFCETCLYVWFYGYETFFSSFYGICLFYY